VTYANSVTERVTFEPGTGRPTDLKAGIRLGHQPAEPAPRLGFARPTSRNGSTTNGDGAYPTTEVFTYDNLKPIGAVPRRWRRA